MKSQFNDTKILETIAPVSQVTETTVVEKMIEALSLYGMKIIAAVIIIVVGLWISKIIKSCFISIKPRQVAEWSRNFIYNGNFKITKRA